MENQTDKNRQTNNMTERKAFNHRLADKWANLLVKMPTNGYVPDGDHLTLSGTFKESKPQRQELEKDRILKGVLDVNKYKQDSLFVHGLEKIHVASPTHEQVKILWQHQNCEDDEAEVSIPSLVKSIAEKHPEVWAKIKPKRFKNVENYHDHRRLYCIFSIAPTFAKSPGTKRPFSDSDLLDAILHYETQKPYEFPMFFVGRQIGEALLQTVPATSFDWQNMRLPFPSFNFVLPHNFMHVGGKEVASIIIARFNRQSLADALAVYYMTAEMFAIDEIFQIYVVCTDGTTHKYSENYDGVKLSVPQEANYPRFRDFVHNLLYLMAARPQYVERGSRQGYHKKSKSDVWTPNFIGLKYRTKTAMSGEKGSHASPRMHWRRGHFRHQPCGEGRTREKVIWIEPILVNQKGFIRAI